MFGKKNSRLHLTVDCKSHKVKCRLKINRHFGGEIGIRTLVPVLAETRFPVVRLRPAQPSLHSFYIIAHCFQKSNRLSEKIFSFFKKICFYCYIGKESSFPIAFKVYLSLPHLLQVVVVPPSLIPVGVNSSTGNAIVLKRLQGSLSFVGMHSLSGTVYGVAVTKN